MNIIILQLNIVGYADKFSLRPNEEIKFMVSCKSKSYTSTIVKLKVDEDLNNDNFLDVRDFFRKTKDLNNKKVYHHIGIYAFTRDALTKYVQLSRSKLEIERNLEQMRAMENNMVIKTGFSDSCPLGVDTKEDLIKVTKEMNL